jgi:uncharacterized protein
MIDGELKSLVENNPLALCSVDQDGNPYCIAVAYCKVIDEDKVLVTDNYMVKTSANIKNNPNVAIAVWNEDWKKDCCGYQLTGEAEYCSKGQYYDKVKKIKENEDEPCKGAILLKVKSIKKLA